MRDNVIQSGLPAIIATGLAIAIVTAFAMTGCSAQPATTDQPGNPTDTRATPDGDGEEPPSATDMEQGQSHFLVATQAEHLAGDAAWCGTMQLCWNALMDELGHGKPVCFADDDRNTSEVENLNDRLFGTADLSEDHYCTYAGPMTYEAKERIERELAERLGQKSDILDSLTDWSSDPSTSTRLLYAMIYRKFSFPVPFGVFEDGWFGGAKSGDNRAEGVTYFEAQSEEQREQITPLYYEDDDSHAVSIGTEEGDEIILVKGPEGETFDEIWHNTMSRADKASTDETSPLKGDESFRCPNLDIDITREYEEWEGGMLVPSEGGDESAPYLISQALQTLRLSLDNEGGEVKSEAAIVAVKSAAPVAGNLPRHFDYDDTFALFVRDGTAGDEAIPYVAVLVNDITRFQDGATKM